MKQIITIYITLSIFIASLHAIKPQQFVYETSLFSWSTEQVYAEGFTDLLDILSMNNINSSYQYFSDEMIINMQPKDYIKKLNEENILTYYLSGNPSWATERRNKSMRGKIKLIAEYNEKVTEDEKFAGIVFDVEPYLLSDWSSDKDNIMTKFLENMIDAYDYAENFNLTIIVCIPYWFDNNYYEILEDLTMKACDKIAVMIYYRNKEINNMRNEVDLCRKYGKSIICISELQPPDSDSVPESITYFSFGLNVLWRMWNQIYSYFDYTDMGFSYHYYKPLKNCIDIIQAAYIPITINKKPYIHKVQYSDGLLFTESLY